MKGEHWGKIVWASVFAVLVIGTAAGTYFFEKNGGSLSIGAQNSPNDTDRDGLTTWEEIAWHTDPNKYDTDGDGASDGAEIAAGTDPLVAGSPLTSYEAATPGASFSESFVQAQAKLGNNPSNADIAAAAKTAAASASIPLPDLTEHISPSALRTSDTESTELYAEITYRILATATTARQNELSLFRQAVVSQNFYGTPALKNIAAQYKSIEGALIAMEVPSKFAAKHLAMVNAIGTMANIVSAMGNWGGDAFAGLAYMNAYSDAQVQLENTIGALFDMISADVSSSS